MSIPGKAGSYWGLSPVGNKLFYVFAKSGSNGPQLKSYDLANQKEAEHGNVGSFVISADQKKMFVSVRGKHAVINLPNGKVKPEKFVDESNMKVMIDLQQEWTQIFNESWRQMRDFFYAPNMHGVDWNSINTKYSALLPYVKNRNDLNYVIGEMIGELSVGHAYVNGGDKPSPKRIKTGLLGAKISKQESGYFKIDEILDGENWTNGSRSPFTEVGVDINEGDFIVAINGKSTKDVNDIYKMLVGTAGNKIEITTNSKAEIKGLSLIHI